LAFVGVENTGQSPQKNANTARTNRMEIQFFDNQTTEKTRSHRPPTPLTSLAEMKITAQLTITRRDEDNGATHHHDHKAHAPTQLHRRWCCPPSVAVRGGLFEVESAVADGRSSSGRGRPEPRQQNVASSRYTRRRSLLRARCPHRIIDSALLRASPPAR